MVSQQERLRREAQRKLQCGSTTLFTDAEVWWQTSGGESSVSAVVKETLRAEKEQGLSARLSSHLDSWIN